MNYQETTKFLRDLKKLSKKFRTLEEDLKVAKANAIELYHEKKIDNRSIFPIPSFCSEKLLILKLKKFACKALKGRGVQSGIRVIYAFFPHTNTVEFMEIYFKADQENEDKKRIQDYLGKLNL